MSDYLGNFDGGGHEIMQPCLLYKNGVRPYHLKTPNFISDTGNQYHMTSLL